MHVLTIRHKDLPAARVSKWSNTKRLIICEDCIQKARNEDKSPEEEHTFQLFQDF